MNKPSLFCFLLLIALLAMPVWAQVTSEDAYLIESVTPDMHIRMVQQIESDAQKISPSQPGGYVVIPIHGGVGWLCDASLVREALRVIDGASVPIPLVVLDIYSPGGLVNDTIEIINAIVASRKSRSYKLIAYVREAGSAAAVIALTADEIYMEPRSNINSSLMTGIWGQRKSGERIIYNHQYERMLMAAQAAAESAGRDVLWADVFVKMNQTVHAETDKEGNIRLVSTASLIPVLGSQKKDHLIRGWSSAVILNSQDAIRFGLAKAVVNDYPEMLKLAGFESLHIGPAYGTRAYIKRGNDWRLAVRHTEAWLDRVDRYNNWRRPAKLMQRDIDQRKAEILSIERTLPPVFLTTNYDPSQKEFVARFERAFKDLEGFRNWCKARLAAAEALKPSK